MNIIWASSEVTPFAKTGGLADVSASLPTALAERGHNVTVILPWYPQITGKQNLKFDHIYDKLRVPMGDTEAWGAVRELKKSSRLRYFFVEYDRFFDRPSLYDWNGKEYDDNARRFIFFSRAVMEIAIHFNLQPDVLHTNDWHTALCCVYQKSHLYQGNLPRCATVLTIHNIGYQGRFPKGELYWTGLGWDYFTWRCLEYYDSMNLLKAAILNADMVNTVSPTYAKEILTPEYAFGMEGALRYAVDRGRLCGILNGIDAAVWNPEKDPLLPKRFSRKDLSGKSLCKKVLQEKFGLPVRNDLPVVTVISRLASQKGLDVWADALEKVLPSGTIQALVIGSGNPVLQQRYRDLARRYPDRMSVVIGMAPEADVHLAEAGSDLFMMPSRYEPCGLNQMYSMRYGTLPVVRKTGGLADTVINCDISDPSLSTGFVFEELTSDALANTVLWAADIWKRDPDVISTMRRNGMGTDFSWDRTAFVYEKMYHDAHKRF